MSFNIGNELLSAIIGVLVGYGLKFVFDKATQVFIRNRLLKRAWQFLKEPTTIIVPLFDTTDVGASGGFGDLLAMADFVTLAKTYFSSEMSITVQAAHTTEPCCLDRNLIVIGGGKHNAIYRDLIEKVAAPLHSFDTDTQSFQEIRNENCSILFSSEYDEHGQLTHDTGLFVRARNPYNSKKWVVIVAGSLTYGTAAAMQYATTAERVRDISKHLNQNTEVIVRARIDNQAITDVERVSSIFKW
jgi:hypothetical protein